MSFSLIFQISTALLRLSPSARDTGTFGVPMRIAGLRPGDFTSDGLAIFPYK